MKLNITSIVLDKLGFSEYWDEHGTWGRRTLVFDNGMSFTIIEQCEMDDDTEGYASNGCYVAQHYRFSGWFTNPKVEGTHELFFLHDMYDCLEKFYPECLPEFIEKCKKLKMPDYLPKLLAFKKYIIK